jgi:DNA-binding XRE family transcriptional regulator
MRMRIEAQEENASADFVALPPAAMRARMVDIPSVVRSYRKRQKMTQEELGKALGLGQATISRWEKGAEPTRENWIALMEHARHFDIELPDPWAIKAGGGGSKEGVWVVGYVGAGAEVIGIDDHAQGAGLEHVDPGFPVSHGVVAVIVRGDSMLPKYEDGELIGYYRDTRPPDELIGKTCVLKLADGRYFIKRIRRGSAPGFHTLVSSNASDIEDVVIEWAGEIRFTVPKGQWRLL